MSVTNKVDEIAKNMWGPSCLNSQSLVIHFGHYYEQNFTF